MQRFTSLSFICICATVLALIESAIFTPEQERQIKEVVESAMQCKHSPGLTVGVVRGSDSWAGGFGFADLDTRHPVEPDTNFMICSLGKAFTMTLLGNLIKDTGYSWSTKVADIEGLNLEFINATLTKEVTLADLLSHRTGLWDVVDYGYYAGYPKGTTIAELSSRLKYIPQRYDFRSPNFLYSNAMYMILGHVIEVLGKDTWYNLVTSRIFEPIGMSKTKPMYNVDDVLIGNVAKPYIRPENDYVNGTYGLYKITPLEPAGGILSNAIDMNKWMRFNLDNGKTSQGQQLVEKELLDEAFKKQRGMPYYKNMLDVTNPPFPINSTYSGYGYGWFTSSYRDFRRISHSGGYFSYISLLWLFPDQDIGLFVNANEPGTPGTGTDVTFTVLSYLADLLLGVEPWLNETTACTYPAPWIPKDNTEYSRPEAPTYTNNHLDDYPGVYGSQLFPDITIALSERGSKLRLLWNMVEGDLQPEQLQDGFSLKITAPWEFKKETQMFGENLQIWFPMIFERDSTGKVQSFIMVLGETAHMPFRKDVRFLQASGIVDERTGSPDTSTDLHNTFGEPGIAAADSSNDCSTTLVKPFLIGFLFIIACIAKYL